MSVKKGVKYKFTLSVIYATQGSIDIVAFTNPMKIIGVSYKPTFWRNRNWRPTAGLILSAWDFH